MILKETIVRGGMNMISWLYLNRLATTMIFIVMSSSATAEVKENLTGIEGGNITLPDPVLDLGFLSYGITIIAMVSKKEIQILEKIYKDKLLWDKNTGLFTITRLQRNDSGTYVIDPKDESVSSTAYKLTVYEAAPTPVVDIVSIRSDSCTLLCSVNKSVETTVQWYKDEQILNQSSSALSLPLTVHRQDFSSSYKCVAANPAEETTLSVRVRAFCTVQEAETRRKHTIVAVISVISVVIVVFVGCTIKWKLLDKKNRTTRQTGSMNTETEVHYTDLHIPEDRHSQGQNVLNSSRPVDRSNLTTVYDKLEVHRMTDTDTAVNV